MIKMRQVIVTGLDFLQMGLSFLRVFFGIPLILRRIFFQKVRGRKLNIDQILPCLTFIYLFMKEMGNFIQANLSRDYNPGKSISESSENYSPYLPCKQESKSIP